MPEDVENTSSEQEETQPTDDIQQTEETEMSEEDAEKLFDSIDSGADEMRAILSRIHDDYEDHVERLSQHAVTLAEQA